MSETNETNETNQAENTPEAVQEDNVEQNQSIEKNKINEEVLETIPVTLSVEVGRSNLKLRDLLKLTQGSILWKKIARGALYSKSKFHEHYMSISLGKTSHSRSSSSNCSRACVFCELKSVYRRAKHH